MKHILLASALSTAVFCAPFTAHAQAKLDPTAQATLNMAAGGGNTNTSSVSPVAAATTPVATAQTGTDNAGNYTGSYAGSNYGTVFQPFVVTPSGGGYAGTFLGSSGGPGSNIDSPNGNSFGIYANSASDASVTVSRAFTTALQYTGDSFSIQLRTNFLGSSSGQTLTYNIGGEALTLSNTGYTLNGSAVTNNLTNGDYILNATYTLGADNSYNFQVQSNNSGDMATATGTFSKAVDQFQIIGTNLPQNQFFNNLVIVNNPAPAPEPSSMIPLLIGALALGGMVIARRRSSSAAQ